MASEQRGETDSLPKKIVKMTVIYILATLLALGLWTIRVRAENIIMVYLISVIILMIEIHQFLWGGIYTVICILSFNFFFTAPRYTLRAAGAEPFWVMAPRRRTPPPGYRRR